MLSEERIYELKIEEDDDVSGIDSISLVDSPAIEVEWRAFRKEEDTCGHRHQFTEDDQKYVSHLMTNSEDEETLLNDGWVIDTIEIITGKENFVSTNPNGPSIEDEKEYKVRYKYILNPDISGPALIPTSRDFCRELIAQNKVFRVEDIEAAVNDFGQSPLVYRGSWNCRHVWARIKYRNDAEIINKASVNKGKTTIAGFPNDIIPDVRVLGYKEPSTITSVVKKAVKDGTAAKSTAKNLGLRTENFDYDVSTIVGYENPGIKKKCKECGWEWDVEEGGKDPDVCHKCGYDNSVTSKPIAFNEYFESFKSYSDYPDSVKNNAKRGIELNEKNGNKCATQVGKVRAQQLANGEPVSEETIRRMYSYLSRAMEYYEEGNNEACGTISVLLWGGKSALSWAESKLNSIEKESLSSQKFVSVDDEKRIVIGPAMIPDQKIFRKDEKTGENYYVYFSSDTIRMIADKYMRNQYTRNNDLMHNGKAITDIYVVESWIKEHEEDKSNKYGYEDLPIGSWFVSMKIPKTPEGDKVWAKVKNRELNGFSVSGYFEEVAKFSREEMFLNKVIDILKQVKD